MAILAYNVSSSLQANLQKIELLRRKILLTPISPKNEVRLKWDATLQRIYWSLSMESEDVNKNEIISLLSKPLKKRPSQKEKEALNYRNAFDYIRQEWTVSERNIASSTVKKLYEVAHNSNLPHYLSNFKTARKEIERVLEYLQTGNENPVIQSGIAQIEIIGFSPFARETHKVAKLISYLFLYKYGFDFREMLVMEEYYRKDLIALKDAIESVPKTKNLTMWLEYYSTGIISQLEKALADIQELKFKTNVSPSFWRLNERQKRILQALENPDERISNKDVQRNYDISQITASRDLAKLTNLGLLFPHGKGRSTYYTKV